MSLQQLISREVDEGMASDRIILGGFSQGAVMSLLAGLTGERRLGGVMALSGWVPLRHQFPAVSIRSFIYDCCWITHGYFQMASSHAKRIPLFFGHGDQDPLVPREVSNASIELLTTRLGIQRASDTNLNGLTYNVYTGLAHSLDETRELPDMMKWLAQVIPGPQEQEKNE